MWAEAYVQLFYFVSLRYIQQPNAIIKQLEVK